MTEEKSTTNKTTLKKKKSLTKSTGKPDKRRSDNKSASNSVLKQAVLINPTKRR